MISASVSGSVSGIDPDRFILAPRRYVLDTILADARQVKRLPGRQSDNELKALAAAAMLGDDGDRPRPFDLAGAPGRMEPRTARADLL